MQVIFLQDVSGVAKRGDVKQVKDGYARNYLIPRKLAEPATEGRLKSLQNQHAAQEKKRARVLEEARRIAAGLEAVRVDIPAHVGESGRLFGAVTSQDVAGALAKLGYNVDRKSIRMDALKTLGDHEVPVHLHEGVTVTLTVRVVPA
ncbi:MAG: 50S ribosomal protein L9 [Clostridia bacterium]|jgi:large subunit ribosomal protein L9